MLHDNKYVKMVSLGDDPASSTSFYYDLKQLNFIPDGFIVSSIYAHTSQANNIQQCLIYCNLLADNIGSTIFDNSSVCVSNPHSVFPLLNSLNTNLLEIRLTTMNGSKPIFTGTNFFLINIQFYKI